MSDCPADGLPNAPEPGEVTWTPEALERLERAPAFLRGMVRKLAERRARAEGLRVITPEVMTRYKQEMMGAAAGPSAAGRPALPWTAEAEALLRQIPEFMRPITRRICEELAAEESAPEVTGEFIRHAETLAEAETSQEPMPWTEEAEACLAERLARTPAMMADFVVRLFKRDVEVQARRLGEREITLDIFQKVWYADQEEKVEWAPEAWARLQTAPEFVRTGIQKAAERRARKEGVKVITSPLLTRYRNQAMLKAVKRIRELGYHELTFEAFEAAKERVRLVSLNPEAQERLDAIRRYFREERKGGHGDTLGEDLMRRFREYLKDPKGAPLPEDE